MFGYRVLHILTHPWIAIDHICDEIKWSWQRVFRGWDDRVIWSIDYHLCKYMPIWLRELRRVRHGFPIEMLTDSPEPIAGQTHTYSSGLTYDDLKDTIRLMDEQKSCDQKASEKWDAILEEIAEGFEAGYAIEEVALHIEEYSVLMAKFDHGMELFKKHFFDLWD